jgi:Transmembrane protein
MVQLTLIRARFITTIGHIIALLVLFTLMPNNIAITIARQGTGDSYYAYQTTTAALIIGCFCFAFDLSGFVMGTSIFNPVV